MKRFLSLSGLCLCLLSFGCGEPTVTEVTKAGNDGGTDSGAAETTGHLTKVDAAGLETLLAENSISIVEFSATW